MKYEIWMYGGIKRVLRKIKEDSVSDTNLQLDIRANAADAHPLPPLYHIQNYIM